MRKIFRKIIFCLVRGGMTWALNYKWDNVPQGYFGKLFQFFYQQCIFESEAFL